MENTKKPEDGKPEDTYHSDKNDGSADSTVYIPGVGDVEKDDLDLVEGDVTREKIDKARAKRLAQNPTTHPNHFGDRPEDRPFNPTVNKTK